MPPGMLQERGTGAGSGKIASSHAPVTSISIVNICASPENIQGKFREHSGNTQGTLRGQLGNIQGTSREHSGSGR